MAEDMSQTETIRILASIQTTNEFILKGMTDLKNEMGKVGEVVQAHAILLQAHAIDITTAKTEAKEATKKVDDLTIRLAAQEVPKSSWSGDSVKVTLAVASIAYALVELVKMLAGAILHPAASAVESVVPHIK